MLLIVVSAVFVKHCDSTNNINCKYAPNREDSICGDKDREITCIYFKRDMRWCNRGYTAK